MLDTCQKIYFSGIFAKLRNVLIFAEKNIIFHFYWTATKYICCILAISKFQYMNNVISMF